MNTAYGALQGAEDRTLRLARAREVGGPTAHSVAIARADPVTPPDLQLFNPPYKHSVCFLLELDRYKKNIQTIFIKNACFDDLLCSGKGTIFYGTMFHVNSHSFFNIEDIFYFKGNNLSYHTQFKKFNVLKTIMTNYIKPCILNKSDIAFGLPLIHTNHAKLMKKIENLPYNVYCIQQS